MKKINLLYVISFAALVVINVLFFLNRDLPIFEFYSHASYDELYIQQETPRISNFVQVPGRPNYINIQMKPESLDSFMLITNGDSVSIQNSTILAKIYGEENSYSITSTNEKFRPIKLSLNKHLLSDNDSNNGDYFLTVENSSIPISEETFLPLKKWKNEYSYITSNDVSDVSNLLANHVGIKATDSDLEKVKKISIFLLDSLIDKKGIPSSSMISSTPYQQYQNVVDDHSELWCGNFAHIFAFFANVAGVTTRQVSVTGMLGSVKTSGHSFNEAYLKEHHSWAFVDLATSKVMVYNKDNKPLNTLDLFQLVKTGVTDSVFVTLYADGQLTKMPYKKINQSEAIQFKHNQKFIFAFPEYFELNYLDDGHLQKKISNYVIPETKKLNYSESSQQSNWIIYLKYSLLYTMFLIIIAVSVSQIYNQIKVRWLT